MSLTPGTRLGPYEVLTAIGKGGMGEVYRARDTTLGRDVAIKVLPAAWSADHDRLVRFSREARVLASLNHPNIGSIYGVADGEGVRGLVLELVDGLTLSDRLAGGPMPIAEAQALARQLIDALDYAHERGVIHRDLKPANLKMTPDGALKVLDFGLAKLGGDDGDGSDAQTVTLSSTRPGTIVGTVAYMSPEQARGKPVDKRTDIWACGCVLYEMAAGRSAFAGETSSDVIARILEREPDWTRLPATTPSGFRRLLERCFEKDPRQRLRDIGDARAILDAPDPGNPLTVGAARSSSRASAWLGWIAATAMAAALVFALRGRGAAESPGSAVPTLSRATRVTNTPAEEFGPAISPDNKWVAYYSNARGPTDVWVRFLETGATLNLTAESNLRLPVRVGLGGLAISPDGSRLAFYARPDATEPTYDTWVMSVPVGGSPHRLLQGMQGLQWSPDGARIVCILPGSSRGDSLVIADGDGSNPRIIIPAEAGRHIHWPAWSRDGTALYFIYTLQSWNTEPAEIYRVPVAGGKPEPIVRTIRRAVYPVPMNNGGLIYAANPDLADLGLWWRPASGGPTRPLITGIGEHVETRLSADGTKLVSTFREERRALVSLPVGPPTDPAQPMQPITDGYSGDLDPSVDPRGDRMVFSSSRSGDRNLWSAKMDGSAAQPLTSGSYIDERPAFSPDGSTIAFVSDRGGERGIWIISSGGGVPRRLAVVDVLDTLTWSRDGTRLLFARPGTDVPTLASVSVKDGAVATFPTPAGGVVPAWSPTADVIAYLEPTTMAGTEALSVPVPRIGLKFVDSAGRPVYTDAPTQWINNGFLAWSPDGKRLAHVAANANAPATVWIIEPNTRTPFRRLLDFPGHLRPRGLSWTRDGSALIIASQHSVSDIVLYDVGSSQGR